VAGDFRISALLGEVRKRGAFSIDEFEYDHLLSGEKDYFISISPAVYLSYFDAFFESRDLVKVIFLL
jgi:hypothetical protein